MTACAIMVAQAANPTSILDPENMGLGVAAVINLERAADGLYRHCGTMPAGLYRLVITDDAGKDHYLKTTGESNFDLSDDAGAATQFAVESDTKRMQVFVQTPSSHYTFRIYKPWDNLYAVGSFNSWTFNHKCTRIDEDNFVWEDIIHTTRGREFKFMGTNDWIDEYGIHPYSSREALQHHTHFYTGGYDNKWEIADGGKHSFEINMFTREMKVLTPGMSTSDGIVVGQNGIRVTTENRVLTLSSEVAVDVAVYDMLGNCMVSTVCDGKMTVSLDGGIYVVKTAEESIKVAI